MPDKEHNWSGERRIHNEEYYYSLIRPEVEKTLSHEQREELRGVFKRIALVPCVKIVDFRTTFWFFKRLYLCIFLGIDRRRDEQYDRWHNLAIMVLKGLVFLLLLAIMVLLILAVLYAAKSAMGIDLFPDRHLRDFIPGNHRGGV